MLPFSAYAVDTLVVNDDFTSADIQTVGSLFIDGTQESDFEKIRNLSSTDFTPLRTTGVSFSASKKVYWVKFYVKNETNDKRNLILAIENPRINKLQVFFENEKKIVDSLMRSGDYLPFNERMVQHRHFVFPVEVLAGEVKAVYLYADKYAENIRLLVSVYDQDYFYETDQKAVFLWSIYLGFLVFFCVLTLIASVVLREKVVFYFLMYSIFIVLNSFAWLGYGFQYIWSDYPYFHNICGNLFIILSSLSLLSLARVYLQTQKYFRLADRIIRVVQYGLGGLLIYLFFYRYFSESVGVYVGFLGQFFQIAYMSIIIILPLLSYFKRGEKDHLIFLAGFLFVFLGMMVHLLENIDWLDSNIMTRNLFVFSFGMDLLLLMYVIGKQIQRKLLQNLEYTNEINILKLEAASALLEGQQQERQRLSLDLHDGISLRLATLKMSFSQLLSMPGVSKNEEDGRRLIVEIGEISEQVRNFTHALSPLDLNGQTFVDAIEDLTYAIEKIDETLDIQLSIGSFKEEKLSSIQKHTLFQTAQELIHNVLKHAEATRVYIMISMTQSQVELIVIDNGSGFDVDIKKSGIGLKNSKVRAAYLNGKFTVKSTVKGSEFRFSFPVETPA